MTKKDPAKWCKHFTGVGDGIALAQAISALAES